MDSKLWFKCEECGKCLSNKARLKDHRNSFHLGLCYRCHCCEKTFTNERNLATHINKKHLEDLTCCYCKTSFQNKKMLLSKVHKNQCLVVKPTTDQDNQISIGSLPKHYGIPEDQDLPETIDYPMEMQQNIQDYWRLIKTTKSTTNFLDRQYNYRWTTCKGDFFSMLTDIYLTEKQCFRVDAAIGCLLKNRETDEIKYWYACHNNCTLLGNPQLIKNEEDLKQIADTMGQLDLTEKFSRPDTKWNLALITNVQFFVVPQMNFVAGCKDFLLPVSITHQHHNLLGMTQDKNHNAFRDNLCLFRCIAQCLTGDYQNSELVFKNFVEYCTRIGIEPVVDLFHGVPFNNLASIEDLFDIDIQIYHTNDSGDATCWRNIIRKHKYLMNLDVSLTEANQVHFSYIVNLDQYAKRYGCLDCGRLFKKAWNLKDHTQNHCNSGQTRHNFPGGVFQVRQSVFGLLDSLDIKVPQQQQYCPYIAVYDFESLLIKQSQQISEKLTFTAQHTPVSCSIATNVPGFEKPACFIDQNPDQLMQGVIDHLESISTAQSEIPMQKYEWVFIELDEKIKECALYVENLFKFGKDNRREKGYLNKLIGIKRKLKKHCEQLVCLGFNSGKYDINLVKRNLFPTIVQQVRTDETVNWPKAILRNGTYLCLSTNTLKFLDASVYAAPGFSLDSFMKAFKAQLTKAKFPYEYLDSFDKLAEMQLPPLEAFYSSLKKENISQEDYEQCQSYWRTYNMTSLYDYLKFYNTRDVEPFLEACINMSSVYWSNFKIDIFREAMSLPGVTERYLFNSLPPDTCFALFSEKTKNLHYSLKSSMRGGLAMVMHRLAVKDETSIRNNPKEIVKSIVGLDFNALYLWAQSMDTPTGHFDYWIPTGHGTFKKSISSKSISIEWLEQESKKCGQFIQHLGNGREKCIGVRQLPIDGYCQVSNTVYEFYGCFWHCHNCPIGQRNKNKDSSQTLSWIKEKEAYILSLGYNLETIWECEWYKKRHIYVKNNMDSFRKFYNAKFVSYSQMEKALLNGSVFGFVKVDISTPDHLKERYSDFPPIIKHAQISIHDIGDHMKRYAMETGQMQKPRKCLISSYFGRDIMLSTPMVQFLVSHGLILEKIHEVIQYDKANPSESFRDVVTKHRKEGDKKPDMSILADTYKLLGNTGYGKTLMNKETHIDVFYCDTKKAIECSYSPYIKQIKCITENCYEVHIRKSEITLDLPIVIGLSVYNWAKIRMLQFFYDILQVYFDHSKYQCMETDTDSIYLALSCDELMDALKPELKQEFMDSIYAKWFVTKPEDKRTPGLLKVEWQGTSMCCLAAKTYIGIDEKTNREKISCKGIMKKINELTFDKYRSVLDIKKPTIGENIGFRQRDDNNMWTYIQQKQGLPYLYVKRKVLEDGVTTIPLDI